jgi:hypothetical protein
LLIIDDIINAIGSANAANAQMEAAKKAMGISDQAWLDQRRMQMPYVGAGKEGLDSLLGMLRGGGPQVDLNADPGYQFRLSEGQKALERSAAARGGLMSGRFAKDLGGWSQGLASQEYGNAWNRAQADYGNRWNRAFGLAGMGQGSAQNIGNFGSQQADRIAQLYGAKGNAEGAGHMGVANGIGGAIRSAGNIGMMGMGGGFGPLGGMGGGGTTLIPTQGASMATGYIPSAGFGLGQLGYGGG